MELLNAVVKVNAKVAAPYSSAIFCASAAFASDGSSSH